MASILSPRATAGTKCYEKDGGYVNDRNTGSSVALILFCDKKTGRNVLCVEYDVLKQTPVARYLTATTCYWRPQKAESVDCCK